MYMKRIRYILFAMLTVFSVTVSAQTAKSEPGPVNIVDRIVITSDSTITFDIPDDMMKDLMPGKPVTTRVTRVRRTVTEQPKRPGIVSGFRIQIFADGRNQSTLQARARARASKVLRRFPEYRHQVYSFSKAPNWYTRIGNFATRGEAEAALSRLRKAFPDFSREIRIVKSNVVVNR